jgi:RNA polymerase sigma-54 factor
MDEDVKAQLGLLPALDALPGYVKDLLVQALGEDGYLREEAVETVRAAAGFSTREVRSLIREIQDAVDPPGLFAKDLVDCLLIQLRRLGLEESDPSILLREGAAFLEKGDFQSLGKHLGWSGQRVEAALSKIRRLDPKPGRIFCPVRPVVPEISFSEGGKGIQVRYLHEYLPRIQIERDLAGLRDRYTDQWDSVKGALKTLSMRAKTKLRLALFLAEIQRPFLLGEVSAPGPVTLEAIAAGTGYHASTVQRVLASTWATTPRGTIALSEAVSRPLASRTDMSVAQLRQAIKGAVAAGMTDRTIAESLGIPRRTITWHRSAVR